MQLQMRESWEGCSKGEQEECIVAIGSRIAIVAAFTTAAAVALCWYWASVVEQGQDGLCLKALDPALALKLVSWRDLGTQSQTGYVPHKLLNKKNVVGNGEVARARIGCCRPLLPPCDQGQRREGSRLEGANRFGSAGFQARGGSSIPAISRCCWGWEGRRAGRVVRACRGDNGNRVSLLGVVLHDDTRF